MGARSQGKGIAAWAAWAGRSYPLVAAAAFFLASGGSPGPLRPVVCSFAGGVRRLIGEAFDG